MSKDDIVKVPKSLLRRVKTEVEDLRAEVARLQAELDAVQSVPPPESASVDLVADLRDQIHEKGAEARAYRLALDKVQAARDALARDLDAARAQIVELGGDPGDRDLAEFFEAPAADEAPEPSATLSDQAPPDRGVAAIGATFTTWCRRGSPLVSRSFLFEAFVREGLDAEATVRPVFRDRHESHPTFRDTPTDGVEYWLVTVGPERALVPQPVSPGQFRELEPTFTGSGVPRSVEEVTPAQVDGPMGGLRLIESGHVEPQEEDE